MTGVSIGSVQDYLPDARDEPGTAPGDRRFRPDVEGLRAVAIALVVLYHGSLQALSGGYVGVDVFFVISGFVITGVLLRERSSSQHTSFLSFYGRRSRRIIPAATLVIVVTVIATYVVLGALYGNPTAVDARWTAVFLANFHFTAAGTNYLTAQDPPSPLLNFWSLAVEEQFYLVYPAFFAVLAATFTRISFRIRLALGLSAVVLVSLSISAAQTNSSPIAAYFSPFARAWELALGALIAVVTPWLLRLPRHFMGAATWVGLAAIGFSAVAFNANTAYPGTAVVVPVLGAALVIAGGVHAPRWAAESILGLRPFRWVGRLSYSLYLWHWPILIIAAEQAGKASLPFRENVLWLLLALAASSVTYQLVENPIRHARALSRGWRPIGIGIGLIATSLVVATIAIDTHSVGGPLSTTLTSRQSALDSVVPASPAQVQRLVRAAPTIRFLPTDLTPSLAGVKDDWGGPGGLCTPSFGQTSLPTDCTFGDPHGTHTMVVYGDSHALMWFYALDRIAIQSHWKLIDLGKGACSAGSLSYQDPPGWGRPDGEFAACDQWHHFAIDRINQLRPSLVIITQEIAPKYGGGHFTGQMWRQGLVSTIEQLAVPRSRVVVLGNIPLLSEDGPECLARNTTNVQACSSAAHSDFTKFSQAERAASKQVGVRYVNVTPWFCSTTCTPVIGRYEVYWDLYHVDATYTIFLANVLGQSLGMPVIG